MIWTLAQRELRSLFVSPLAWVILAVVEGIMAYFFLGSLDFYMGIQPRLAAMPDAPGVTEVVVSSVYGTAAFVMLGVILLMPLSLALGTNLDWGLVLSGLLGLALLLASFAAVGLFMSTLTAQPTVAAIASFGVLLLLWILDFASQGNTDSVLSYLSMLRHYQPLLKGLFDSSDLVYYALLTLTFLVLSIRRLDAERLQR